MTQELIIFIFLSILKTWWWLFLPIVLYYPAVYLYLNWIRWDVWYPKKKWIILEIIPPGEIEKPFRAMEDLFSSLWILYGDPNWREAWCEGALPVASSWFSCEILGLEGDVHFYLRLPENQREFAETIIHSHYPETEIFEVDDYTKNVPQNIPNDTYDLKGEDYVFLKNKNYLPIKTYKFFEPVTPELIKEGGKKIDSFTSLMEALTKMKKGEQFWFQIVAAPIVNSPKIPWIDEAKKEINRIAQRPGEAKGGKSIFRTVFDILVFEILAGIFSILFSSTTSQEKLAEAKPQQLTPGERNILEAIEEKISKNAFKVHARALYIYQKNAYNDANAAIARNYFAHFSTAHLNSIILWIKTRTKVQYWFRDTRVRIKKMNIFEKYVKRFPSMYPIMTGKGNMVLNIEELASIFHFPVQASVLPSGVPRIMSRKATPPSNLSTE
jgi:hypothetical protein